MESIELFCIKRCRGNLVFDYVYNASVGNSGGILYVWDPNMFKKTNSTVSYYFVMVRGDWMPNGEVVIMGDFNEVRNKSERFRTLFNRHGADVFNRFISNTRLKEVNGFDKFIEDSWKDAPIIESNALVRMMKKLKYLKEKIGIWNKLNKEKSHKSKRSLLAELADYDAIIDKGEGENNVVNRRTEVVNLLQEVEKKNSLEAAQKAKIKGDKKKAVWDYGIDKYPGPDRFTFGFYCRYWKLIENYVVDVMTCFFHQGSFPKGGNSSFIILIPKTPNANTMKDYGSISLIGSMYKIISKILANRLVVFNGVRRKKTIVGFKVDFKKVYDSVRWDHLDDIMRKFSFGEKWCMWIQSCLRSSRGLLIVNGSPTEDFQFYKGLKQGDPLSPFLFILVMESLHISFQRVVDVGLFKGIELAFSLNLSYMFYADDAFFMGQWSESNIDTIVKVLDCFNRTFGLRINMTKRSKVGRCMSRIQSWNETIERMACRLSKWKLKTLSIGDNGGLGVSSLFVLNRALMFKWVWRSITQGSSLWARVIKALHGYDTKIGQKVKSCYPLLWLDIIHEMEMFKSRGIDFVSLIHSKLGNRANTSFWEVAWPGGSPFKSLFPRGGVELQQFEHMKEKVEGCILADMMDRWFWALEGSGEFTITSVRKMIDDFILSDVSSKTRWIKAVPIKVNVHAWKVKLDGLPTRLNISRRCIDIKSILCPMC
nr:RNA-directed DNA polymerase, eukaryota [Tanacetum cinerariifolium]